MQSPFPAHCPATDNFLIGCTSHELTDDWLLVRISMTASTNFGALWGAFFYRSRFIWPQCTIRQYHSDLFRSICSEN